MTGCNTHIYLEEVWPRVIIYHQVSQRNCECTEKEENTEAQHQNVLS